MKTLAVTRPKNSLKKSREVVEDMGFEFYGASTIDLFLKDNEEVDVLKERIRDMEADFVVFTSKNGTRFFFEELGGNKLVDELEEMRVISIGPKTADKVNGYGVDSEVPGKYSSSGLVSYLGKDVDNKNVEIARSSHGSEVLVDGLRKNGANVHDVPLYAIGLPEDISNIKELINDVLDGEIDILTFTSKMTFINLMKVAEEMSKKQNLINKMNELEVAAIGDPTKKKIKEYGVNTVIAPRNYTFQNMLKAVVKED